MRRRVFNLLTLLSLPLFVAVVGLWVRSYFVGDQWTLAPGRVTGKTTSPWGEVDAWRLQYTVSSGTGRLQVVRIEGQDAFLPGGRTTLPAAEAVGDYAGGITRSDRWLKTLGFGFLRRDKQYEVTPAGMRRTYWGFRVATVPYWFLAAITGLAPASWLAAYARRRKRRLRAARSLCPACGYDLRATPAQCPECGQTSTPAEQAL
jgi:hypothetical protein